MTKKRLSNCCHHLVRVRKAQEWQNIGTANESQCCQWQFVRWIIKVRNCSFRVGYNNVRSQVSKTHSEVHNL